MEDIDTALKARSIPASHKVKTDYQAIPVYQNIITERMNYS